MTELLIISVVVLLGWAIFRAKRRRHSTKANEHPKGNRGYVPDPLEHLDVKPNDRSIIAQSVASQPVQFEAQTSIVRSAEAPKPNKHDYQFEIEYVNKRGEQTRRRIAWVNHQSDGQDTLLHAYCALAQAHRTFRSSRIQSCRNLWTGRQIKDLGRYFRNGSYLR